MAPANSYDHEANGPKWRKRTSIVLNSSNCVASNASAFTIEVSQHLS